MRHPQTPSRRQGRAERSRVLAAQLLGARLRLADVTAGRLPGDPAQAAARVAELEAQAGPDCG